MSLVTVSKKRNRVYNRAFDHDEARKLYAKGWQVAAIARAYGVTDQAVKRVCDPELNKKMSARTRQYLWAARSPCKGGCGRLVWTNNKRRSGYCNRCVAILRTAADTRAGELRCLKCEMWMPDDAFTAKKGRAARRGRTSWCRTCQSTARREYRHRNPTQAREESHRAVKKRRENSLMSLYVVLQPNGDGFKEFARVEASNANHAIEKVATGPGRFLAVLESKFRVVEVEPVQAFRVKSNA